MGEVKWNEGQQQAINSIDRGTVVAAAAGSGKTAVLIERTIRMLLDPILGIEADSILAVTFTNDAANQMKEKLSKAMKEKLEQDPSNEWIAKQQELLPLASICTIDSFCMELVKNNINEFELSADFSIIDGVENQILTEKAFNEASEWYFINRPENMKILMDNFAEENDSEVIRAGMELHKFNGSLPFPEQWRKNCFDVYEKIGEAQNSDVMSKIVVKAKALKRAAERLKKIADEIGNSGYESYVSCCNEYVSRILNVKGNKCDESVINARQSFSDIKFPRRPNKSKTPPEINIMYDKIAEIKKGISDFIKSIDNAVILSDDEIEHDKKETVKVFDVLWEFVLKAEEILWGYKTEKNKVYFSDVTDMVIRLLSRPTENGFERTELSQKIVDEKRYKIILIDEYQDVNDLQDIIFRCISDTDDVNIMGKNVFIVGDIKQSIYGFRQSNPMIFDRVRKLAVTHGYEDKLRAVLLKKNYRSRKNIIDFTNFIFENVMSDQIGDVVYNEDEALVCGAVYPGNDPETDILLIDTEVTDENEEDTDKPDPESAAVARKIRSMIDGRFQVSDNGVLRNCRGGDFCILLRTSKKIQQYIKAMEAVGLSAVTDSVSGYLGAREVSLAVSMLKIIDNPMQDIPFAAVCLSQVFGFTADELSEIRLVDKQKKLFQLFLAVSRDDSAREYGYEAVEINNKKLQKKCRDTVNIISKLRFFASGMPLEKLVRKIYDTTDFMSVAAAFEDSQQKRANLRLLIKLASDYENSTGGGLSDFIRYLDSVSQSGKDFEEALTVSASDKTVIIKTIHKSKGLEYPIVVLGDIAKEYNISNSPEKIICNERIGAAVTIRDRSPKYNRRTVFYNYINNARITEQLSEELRILYVALTRAKEKLIIPLYFKSRSLNRIKKAAENLSGQGKPSYIDIETMRSYSEILTYALLCCHNRNELCDFLDIEANGLPNLSTEAVIEYELCKPEDNSENIDISLPKAPVEIALFGRIVDNLTLKESSEDTDTVSKLSVTEFVRELSEGEAEKEITYFPPVPDFSKETKSVSAADKGTYTHLFMELADFEKAENDPADEIDRLVSLNKMTEFQAENVNINTVEKFFESDLYKRCKNAVRVMREQKFMVRLSDMTIDDPLFKEYNNKDVMVQGIADLIIEEYDGFVIVDYKTDNVKQPQELIDRHRVQLVLYKSAFELIFGKKVKECYIYSFKLMIPIKVEI